MSSSLITALVDRIRNDPAVAAFIGSGTDARVRGVFLPPEVPLPAVSLFVAGGGEAEFTLGGPDGLQRASVQVDAWGRTQTESRGLFVALRRLLEGKPFTDPNGKTIQNVIYTDSRELNEPDIRAFRVTATADIWHEEG